MPGFMHHKPLILIRRPHQLEVGHLRCLIRKKEIILPVEHQHRNLHPVQVMKFIHLRQRLLKIAEFCPVHKTLHNEVDIISKLKS